MPIIKNMEKQPQLPNEDILAALDNRLDSITDGLGLEIDPSIRDAVKYLLANGFHTTQSCEGHIDRGMPYPWVDIGTLLDDDEAFQALSKKITYDEATDTQTNTQTSEEKELYEQKRNMAMEANALEVQRMRDLLSEFYSTSDSAVKLTLQKKGWNRTRLQPENVPGDEEELREKLSPEEIENKLKKYQAEMNRFTEFLKDKFVESKSN
jgi:hypothetical protein